MNRSDSFDDGGVGEPTGLAHHLQAEASAGLLQGTLEPCEYDGGKGLVDLEGIKSSIVSPARSRTFRVAGMLSVSIRTGSSAAIDSTPDAMATSWAPLHHTLGGEVQRLLATAALTIHCDRGHWLRKAG